MDRRVKFDFEIDFINGGGILGRDFRLDILGEEISDKDLADYLVQDMRLLMVNNVRILNKQIVLEPHKRVPEKKSLKSSNYIDLSHVIHDGLITYKGLPAPIICDYLSREASRERYEVGTEFQIGRIDMIANTGTYIDCPFHRYAQGKDLSQVDLERFADLEGIVIRADHRDQIAVGVESFQGKDLKGRAVLVHTGWDEFWETESYFDNHPFLTEQAAEYLRASGVGLVGIDSMNIDDTRGKSRPVHSILLAEDILIVEHLCNLKNIPDEGFKFSGVPPKFMGVGTFPIRAFAKI